MALDFVVDTFVGSDGSKYYGTLRNGVPSGLGTCIWPNQCHYDGEWRDGLMHGFGTYVWATGQRYDGEWKDGRRDGIGIKTYADGSMYDGFWKGGKKHGLGVFRPAPEETGSRRHSNHMAWQPQQQPTPGDETALPGLAVSPGASAGQEQFAASTSSGSPAHAVNVPWTASAAPKMVTIPSGCEGPFAEALARSEAAAAGCKSPRAVQLTSQHHGVLPGQQLERLLMHPLPAKPGMISPFVAAASALSSEASVFGEPPKLLEHSWQDPEAAGASQPGNHAAAGDAEAASSSQAAASKPAAEGAVTPATPSAAGGAPRKLFVREYNMGHLVREYPLTAEEIKMIFGFLWPKQNKVRRHVQRVLGRGPRMQKKLGEVVYKGHFSYSLMLELQLGIRYSVGRGLWPQCSTSSSLLSFAGFGVLAPWASPSGLLKDEKQQRKQKGSHERKLSDVLAGDAGGDALEERDFKHKRTVYFPSCGSSTTPAHPSVDFKWKDYCPRVFHRLRTSAGIDEADYMLSLAGAQALRQLNSPGKSGSMFLLSEDERFLVKTMRKSEMNVLLDMLPAYAAHMEKHPHSLITRFFGLHKVRPLHGRSVRFVVMANIFVTDLQIHRRYDIKGSTEGRTVGPEARAKAADGDPSIIFKDLDVDTRIVLEQSAHEKLLAQLAADCELLKTVGVMDYSLLLGVHYPSRNYTRASLEAVPSMSLDGILPQTSPLPGGTLPGSAMGSFSETNGTAGGSAAAAAAMTPLSGMRAPTQSDDDVQQPPQHLQRLVAQQQLLAVQLQQAQQQGQQQQTARPGEFMGPWSASGAARLTGASSLSSMGSERLSLEQPTLLQQLQSVTGAASPQPPSQHQQQQLEAVRAAQQGQTLTSWAGSAEDGQQAAVLQRVMQQIGPPATPVTPPFSSGGAAAAAQGMMPAWSGAGYGSLLPSLGGTAGGAGTAAGHPAGWSGNGAAVGSTMSGAGGSHAHMLANMQGSASGAGARNWELFSGAAELEERLSKIAERMKSMGFSEQRIKDVEELARLKILGSKLKKSATRKEPPSAVLQAMQQQRQVAEGTAGGAPPVLEGPHSSTPLPGATSPSTAGAAGPLVRHQTPTLSHLTSLRGAFTGLGVPFEEDEQAVDTPMALGLPDPRAPAPTPPAVPHAAAVGITTAAGLPLGHQLGINMLALAVPQPCAADAAASTAAGTAAGSRRTSTGSEGQRGSNAGAVGVVGGSGAGGSSAAGGGSEPRRPEEVVLCFGIIDILQDYSTRKVLERTVKGLTHDKAAISVAPPKAYARRFLEFVSTKVFMSENDYYEQVQVQQQQQQQLMLTQTVLPTPGFRVSETSSIDDGPTPAQQQQVVFSRQPAPAQTAAAVGDGAYDLPPSHPANASASAAGQSGYGDVVVPTPTGAAAAEESQTSGITAELLATAGADGMGLELLGSPGVRVAPAITGPASSAPADSLQAGFGQQLLELQSMPQLVSAEEVSVSVAQVQEGLDNGSSEALHPVAQHTSRGGQMLPAVVVELQPGPENPGNAGLKQQPLQPQRHQALMEEDDAQGGSSSPAEAEVIVVDSSQQQHQQRRLGTQHASLLAKLQL